MEAGVINISKTTKVTAPAGTVIYCIDFKEDTVIKELTAAAGYLVVDETGTKKIAATSNAITHPAGTTLYGRYKDITLTSGVCVAYLTR